MPNREQSIPPITADHGEASGSLGQRAKSGAIWITVEMVSIQLVSIVVFAVLARFIGPAQFGLMSISYVLVYSTRWIVFENIATAISRKARPTELEFTTAFWMTLGASLVSFVAFEGLTLVADKVFRTPGLAEILRPMGVILIGMGLSRTHEVWLSRHFRFQSLAIRAAVAAVVGGAVGVGCAMAGLGVWALVAQQMAMALTALACLWLATPWRPTLNFCSDTAKDVVHFVRDTSGASLLNTLNESVDTVMVAAFFGAESVGLRHGEAVEAGPLFHCRRTDQWRGPAHDSGGSERAGTPKARSDHRDLSHLHAGLSDLLRRRRREPGRDHIALR